MNRIGSGISEGDELAESAGRRGKLSFALPSKTHVHGVNFVIYRLKIDAMPDQDIPSLRACFSHVATLRLVYSKRALRAVMYIPA